MTTQVTADGSKMEARLKWQTVSPNSLQAMRHVSDAVESSGLERSLILLIDIRVSQLNGCSYCLDMHAKDARADGETEQRVYELSAWRETPFYSPRERAGLAWAEAVTLLSEGGVAEKVFDEVRRHFSEKELVDLTLAINAINCWNRFNVAFGTVPGSYVPKNRS